MTDPTIGRLCTVRWHGRTFQARVVAHYPPLKGCDWMGHDYDVEPVPGSGLRDLAEEFPELCCGIPGRRISWSEE